MTKQIAKAEAKPRSIIAAFEADLTTIQAAMNTNIGPEGLSEFDLSRIKIPTGGGIQWPVSSLEEGDKFEADIEGVIELVRQTRGYHSQPISEGMGNQPPDCSSPDGVNGIGNPGGNCGQCPFSKYGSASGGRGQACKQTSQVFVLRGSLLLPEVFSLPPTSLKSVRQYLLKLTAQGLPYYAVVTGFSLERTKNALGIAYSRAVLRFVRRLSQEELSRARQYHEMLRPLVQNMLLDIVPTDAQDEGQL